MKLKILITKEVLEATKMCSIDTPHLAVGYNCAIAYAIRKIFPEAWTDLFYVKNGFGKNIQLFTLPDEATQFIKEFDKATPEDRVNMKPFDFEVELTDAALDLISIDEITEVLKDSTTLEVV